MSDHAIVVEGLEKSYGSVCALCGVDFAGPDREHPRPAGPERSWQDHRGAHLATLLEPDAGSARVAGLDVVSEAAALRAASAWRATARPWTRT